MSADLEHPPTIDPPIPPPYELEGFADDGEEGGQDSNTPELLAQYAGKTIAVLREGSHLKVIATAKSIQELAGQLEGLALTQDQYAKIEIFPEEVL